tara:strand:- start:501 stop:1202 length:702 start_codon:yes stop_codon:yes gene_type:complete
MFKISAHFSMYFAVLFSALHVSAQDINPKIRTGNKWHKLGLDIVSEVHYEGQISGIPEYPDVGFDLYYSRKKEGKFIEHGFSLGWQPIGTTSTEVFNNVGIQYGELRATNQMFHIHYTPRITVLKSKPFSPYIEGVVGFKGAALTKQYIDVGGEIIDRGVEKVMLAHNYGFAVGFNWKILDRLAFDMRYAAIENGDLQRITNVSIGDDDEIIYDQGEWKAPVGYFRMGVCLIL